MDAKMTDQQCALYRLYDASGALLYVGITATPDQRFKNHAKNKAWWPEVTKQTITWHDNRKQAAEPKPAQQEMSNRYTTSGELRAGMKCTGTQQRR